MQRRQSCTQQHQARLHLICISSAYDFWILDRLFCILCFLYKKNKTNNNERELCAFSDSWAQPACFWATWETCSTRHRRTPAQLDDARCQTGVSRGGTPASLQHPTICLKTTMALSVCRKRETSVASHRVAAADSIIFSKIQ